MVSATTTVLTVSIILNTLAIITVALRLWSRFLTSVGLGVDDYLVLLALILSMTLAVLTDYFAVVFKIGDSTVMPSPAEFTEVLKAAYALELIQIASMGLVKMAILFFYMRIFISQRFQHIAKGMVGIVFCWTLAVWLAVFFSKWPISGQWDPTVPYNINTAAVLITFVSGNFVLDLLTLCLPLVALQHLQISRHRKYLLSSIFCLGTFCVAASLARLYYAVSWTKVVTTPFSFFQAPFTSQIFWALLEPPVFVTTICLPTFGPLYHHPNGPGSLLRSLRSRLLSSPSSSGTVRTDAPQNMTKTNSAQDPKADNISERHLVNGQGSRLVTNRAHLESFDLEDADHELTDVETHQKAEV